MSTFTPKEQLRTTMPGTLSTSAAMGGGQPSLFDEYNGFEHPFPDPQYLGAKHVHRAWLSSFIPSDSRVVLDAFGGSQSVAFLFKQLGKVTLTNDFMRFSDHIGKALIENSGVTLEPTDIGILFSPNRDPEVFNLMGTLFADLFFTKEEAAFLDGFRSNVALLDNPYKQSLALTIMCRAMTRKITMGHFAHTPALVYAADPARIRRNRSLIRPPAGAFHGARPRIQPGGLRQRAAEQELQREHPGPSSETERGGSGVFRSSLLQQPRGLPVLLSSAGDVCDVLEG